MSETSPIKDSPETQAFYHERANRIGDLYRAEVGGQFAENIAGFAHRSTSVAHRVLEEMAVMTGCLARATKRNKGPAPGSTT
ncbi:MAG TPA: hypothetical protein VMV79_05410 [Alphaproteobacteria bacterium]|nr:hypothetical protein [Alphaproteobacteria bacterium]